MDHVAPHITSPRLLRLPQVIERTGFAKSFLYQAIEHGTFPRPVKCGRSSLFVEAEIDQWVRSRIAEREGHSGNAPPRLLVTEAELAEALAVSVSWLQKDRSSDRPAVPFVKLGTAVRYDLNDARDALKRMTRGGRA